MKPYEHIMKVLTNNIDGLSSAFMVPRRAKQVKDEQLYTDDVLDEYTQGIDLQKPIVFNTIETIEHIEVYI